jgi:nucleotide-binding universal stress UspA family protein
MTGRIVIGIDGSAAADRALAWGLDDAERRGSTVDLVSVFTLPIVVGGMVGGYVGPTLTSDEIVKLRDTSQAAMAERVERARTSHPTLTVTAQVVQGSPAPVLLEKADGAELVVLGSEGSGAFEALVLGSVSHTVAHRASCPVVLVPEGTAAGGPRRVIVGVDGSSHSDAAVDVAAREAALAKVELVIVHAWSYPYRRRQGENQAGDQIGSMMQADADAVLAAAAARAGEPTEAPPEVTTRLVEGSPVDVLIDAAGPEDLVVVGARGRGALRSILLGSTSASLIHHARGPVIVVHP